VVDASGPIGDAQGSVHNERKASEAQKSIKGKDCGLKTPVQDCVVCATELLHTVNIPWRRIASQCGHQSTICLSCLQQHIQNQLATIACDKISCPICSVALSSDDIQAWSAPDFFARYMRISIQHAILGGLSFRWCGVPECQNGFLCDPERESYVACNACGRMTCLSCNVEYHSGICCKDFQRQRTGAEEEDLAKRNRADQEQRSMAEIGRRFVKCPGQNCGAPIEKTGGCDHMTYKVSIQSNWSIKSC
jgi:IBR domain, a half RING-finger domain